MEFVVGDFTFKLVYDPEDEYRALPGYVYRSIEIQKTGGHWEYLGKYRFEYGFDDYPDWHTMCHFTNTHPYFWHSCLISTDKGIVMLPDIGMTYYANGVKVHRKSPSLYDVSYNGLTVETDAVDDTIEMLLNLRNEAIVLDELNPLLHCKL